MIKAIETRYKGYRFRSRLEARWAVFFDCCGYNWEYEPQGFELPCGTRYLPDFRIFGKDANGDTNSWLLEVKPEGRGLSDPKVQAFIDAYIDMEFLRGNDKPLLEDLITGYGDFIVLDGPPSTKPYYGAMMSAIDGSSWYMMPGYRNRPSFWQSKGDGDYFANQIIRFPGHNPAASAIEKALGARFEHGETP